MTTRQGRGLQGFADGQADGFMQGYMEKTYKMKIFKYSQKNLFKFVRLYLYEFFQKKRTYKFDEIEEIQLRACYRYYHNGKHSEGISMLSGDFYMLSETIAAYRSKKKKECEIQ